jgi:hypothetical protein
VNDDSEGIKEVIDMMGVMYLTALEMLHESGLISPTSPLPDNIGVMTLHFLDFMINTCSDFDLEWVHEIVRAANKFCVVLSPVSQIEGVDKDKLDELKDECEQTKMKKGLAWKTEVSSGPFWWAWVLMLMCDSFQSLRDITQAVINMTLRRCRRRRRPSMSLVTWAGVSISMIQIRIVSYLRAASLLTSFFISTVCFRHLIVQYLKHCVSL